MITSALYAVNLAMARSDALARTYANNDAMLSMMIKQPVTPVQSVGFMGDSFVRQKDLNFELENIQNAIKYRFALANQESLKEAQDKDVKRKFSWWA